MIFQILSDESGKPSAARILLCVCLAFTAVIITADALLWATVPHAAYSLLTTVEIGLLSWAAGPRIAQYLLPGIGQVTAGVASALIPNPKRPAVLDNDPRFHDDER